MRDECTRPEDPGERSAYEAGYEAGMSLAASREAGLSVSGLDQQGSPARSTGSPGTKARVSAMDTRSLL